MILRSSFRDRAIFAPGIFNMRSLIQLLERRSLFAAVSFDGGGGTTRWDNPLNWSNDAVPTNADDVTINTQPGVALLTPESVHSLTVVTNLNFFNATLTVAGELRVKAGGVVSFPSGTVDGAGKIVVEQGASWSINTLSGSGPRSGDIRVAVENHGSMSLTGGHDIGPDFDNFGTVAAYEGGIYSGTFTNEAGAKLYSTFVPTGPGDVAIFGVGPGPGGTVGTPFINHGVVFTSSPGGPTSPPIGSDVSYSNGQSMKIYMDATPTVSGTWNSLAGYMTFSTFGATPATIKTDASFAFTGGTLILENINTTLGNISNGGGLRVGRLGPANVTITQPRLALKMLQIFDGGTVGFPQNSQSILRAEDVGITAAGRLDIAGGLFIDGNVPYFGTRVFPPSTTPTPAVLPAYADALRSSLAGDVLTVASNNPSSTRGDHAVGFAVGAGLASLIPSSQILGETFDANDFIYRATLRGDANLDRTVDFADLTTLAQHYNGTTSRGVANGNFDNPAVANGAVDFADLVFLSQNYGLALTVPAPLVVLAGEAKATFSKSRGGKLAELR
jgi:hypothetical protein